MLAADPACARLVAVVEDFTLALRSANRSEGTVEWYTKKLASLVEHLGDVPVASIRTGMLRRWLLLVKQGRRRAADGRAIPASDRTVEHHRKAARRLFSWAAAEEPPLVPHDPTRGLAPWLVEERELAAPTPDAVRAFVSTIRSSDPFIEDRDGAIAALFIGSGVRVGELVRIRLADVDAERGIVIHGKTRRERRVPLTPHLRAAIITYVAGHHDRLEVSGLLFPHRRGGPLSTNAVRKRLALARGRAELDAPLHPHALRHYFGTEFLRDGGDRKVARMILGHRSDAMLDRYVHFIDSDVDAQAEAHSPFERLAATGAL